MISTRQVPTDNYYLDMFRQMRSASPKLANLANRLSGRTLVRSGIAFAFGCGEGRMRYQGGSP